MFRLRSYAFNVVYNHVCIQYTHGYWWLHTVNLIEGGARLPKQRHRIWIACICVYLRGTRRVMHARNRFFNDFSCLSNARPESDAGREKNEKYNDTGNVEIRGTARVWLGWPPFEMRQCKFELEQWMNGCGIEGKDLRNEHRDTS